MGDFIPWAKPSFWGKETEYMVEALQSTMISGGPFIEKLERQFSEIFNTKYVLSTSNGTASLHLAYLSIGLQPGDEIIVPGFAFMAAANIALHMKLKPVFAEVDPNTWCLTAPEIEKKITARTRAIVPVHTYGNMCPMPAIMELAKGKGITVIEDCAESLFSRYAGRYCGTFGDVNTFSFHATKTITTGEGGLVVTEDEDIYRKMLLYRSHGLLQRGRYYHELPGHNFRLTNLQAALGCAQLEQRERIVSERRRVHRQYKKHLAGKEGITLQEFEPNVDPILWALAARLDERAFPQGRDGVIEQLRERGIETRPGFIASSLMKIYEPHRLPISEAISQAVISLPTFATLTDEQIQAICTQILRLKR
jgi:perosamine synthetase